MGPNHLLCWVQVGLDTLHWDLYTTDRMAKNHWDLNEKLPHEVRFMKEVMRFVTPAFITEFNRALMGFVTPALMGFVTPSLMGFVTPAFIVEVNGALWPAIKAGGSFSLPYTCINWDPPVKSQTQKFLLPFHKSVCLKVPTVRECCHCFVR